MSALFDWARPVYEPVPGAPLQPGMCVQVVDAIDEDICDVRPWLGKVGMVRYLEYSCGCGQSYPDDPMIGVEFCNGTKQEFWQEELSVVGWRT